MKTSIIKPGLVVLGTIAVLAIPTMAMAAPTPAAFVRQAIRGDNSEIMLGKLAESRGGTAGVRDFGQTLVSDHTKAKQQMAGLAHSMNITPPSQPMREAKAESKKLSDMKGSAFDTAFVNYMIKDHQKDIQNFQSEANANNGAASTMAKQQLPTLRKHLNIAESLQTKEQGQAR